MLHFARLAASNRDELEVLRAVSGPPSTRWLLYWPSSGNNPGAGGVARGEAGASGTVQGGLKDVSEDREEVNVQAIGNEAEFVDDAIDDDEVDEEQQLLLDRKELQELGLELDNPDGFADE